MQRLGLFAGPREDAGELDDEELLALAEAEALYPPDAPQPGEPHLPGGPVCFSALHAETKQGRRCWDHMLGMSQHSRSGAQQSPVYVSTTQAMCGKSPSAPAVSHVALA